MGSPLLQIDQLSIGYHKKKPLFEQLDLQIQPGEFICLLGPNGAGKSTLLKTLLGLLQPINGELKLCQKSFESYSELERAKTISAMLTDRLQTDHMNALDLVLLGRYPHRTGFRALSSEDQQIARRALEQVHAHHLSERKVDTLSDGERQRILLARAIAQDPQLLLLDEPTSFLDYPHKVETFYFLKKWVQHQKRSVIMSTHDLDLSLSLADRIILLQPGNTMIEGAPEDLALSGDLGRVFQSEHLSIDHHNGKFKINLETQHSIHLIGEGEIFCWTEKALRRSGYFLDEKSDIKVSIINKSWVTEIGSVKNEHTSIHALVQSLKSETPS